jgi:uncharacterized OB-fold protein
VTASLSRHGLTVTVEGREHLVGSRCPACATLTFPVQDACPRCGGATVEAALPTAGTVWSWTVQRTQPKPPYPGRAEFTPFAVGYVDLGPVRVEARLEGRPPDTWRIGQPVHLVPAEPDEHGDVWSYRFEPDGEAT